MAEVGDLGARRDRDLLEAIGRRDAAAFADLMRRHGPAAQVLARRVLRQQPLAEEAVQEAFLQVWREHDRFQERRGSVRTWVMTLVHARAVDLVRREEAHRRRVEAAAASDPLVVPDPAPAVIEEAERPRERAAVLEALGALPDAQRQVIELMYFGGQTQQQIAIRLGVPLGTVKSRTMLGMRRMRAALAEVEP